MTTKVPCSSCGAEILPSTAERLAGRCAPCAKGTRAPLDAAKQERLVEEARRAEEALRREKAVLFTDVDSLIRAVQSLTDLDDEADLVVLETVLASLPKVPHPERTIPALFGLFERFPWTDGHGTFWGVLHELERMAGYEAGLVASVRRSPGEFNLLMLGRMLNAGSESAAGVNVRALLREIASAAEHGDQARAEAVGILGNQGRGDA